MQANKSVNYGLLPLFLIIILAPIGMRYFSQEEYNHLLHPDLFQPTGVNSNLATYIKSLILKILGPITLIAALYFGKDKLNVYTLILLAIFLSLSISTFNSDFPSIALHGSPHMFEGYFAFVAYLIIAFAAYSLINDRKSFILSIISLGIPILIMGYMGIPEMFGKFTINEPMIKNIVFGEKYSHINLKAAMEGKIASTLYNPNFLGHFTSMVLLFFGILFLFIQNKYLKLYALIVFITLCFLTFGASSRSSFIGMGIAGIIALIYLREKIFPVWRELLILAIVFIGSMIIVNIKTEGYLYSFLSKSTEKEIISQERNLKRNLFVLNPLDNLLEISTNGKKIVLLNEDNKHILLDEKGKELKVKAEIVNTETEKEVLMKILDDQYRDFVFQISKFNDQPIFKLKTNGSLAFPIIYTKEGYQTIFNNKIIPIINSPSSELFKNRESLASNRGFIWKYSIPLIDIKPFFGHGAGAFPIIFPNNDYLAKHNFLGGTSTSFSFVHNLYLQILIEFGWMGFSLFALLFIYYLAQSAPLYWNFKPHIGAYYIGIGAFISIISYLIAGLFNNSFVGSSPVLFMILGIGIACNRQIKKSSLAKDVNSSTSNEVISQQNKNSFAKKMKNKKLRN
jgi:hypothetical protein